MGIAAETRRYRLAFAVAALYLSLKKFRDDSTHYFSGRSVLMEAVDAAALDASSALNR